MNDINYIKYIKQLFYYGKCASKSKRYILFVEVPKSWFKHFYIYSSFLTTFTLILMIFTLIFNIPLHPLVFDILDIIGGATRQSTVSDASALLVMFLYTLHSYRRLYETHCVSVFAKSRRMHVLHYLSGFSNFTAAVGAILIETSSFVRSTSYESTLNWTDLTFIDLAALLLFLWASWRQYKIAVILADLRKNQKGIVTTQAHKLPHGDWFEYVSSPHLFAEILMYIALTVMLWNNTTWMYLFVWVISNQIQCALLSHWWYQATFKDIPKTRKVIIPFIF